MTTYTYSTSVNAGGTVSANDDERLLPGSFSLRDGFPAWYGEGKRRSRLSRDLAGKNASPLYDDSVARPSITAQMSDAVQTQQHISIAKILEYVQSTFESADVLDTIPIECADSSGAWHAWRAHRSLPKYVPPSRPMSPIGSPNRVLKQPGEWNWDGVWESRVKSQIEASKSESVLFGPRVKDETIRFADLGEERLQAFRDEMLGRSVGE